MTFSIRQGDVNLRPVAVRPTNLVPVARDNGRCILAYGEVTGHAHAFSGPGATLLRDERGRSFVEVSGTTKLRPTAVIERNVDHCFMDIMDRSGLSFRFSLDDERAAKVEAAIGTEIELPGEALVHEEHHAVVVMPGLYSLPGQREYTSADMAPIRVAD
jgi:hypothetical protein